jgi:predicted  nucleic acid-binding Zn-ribbon protein
VKFDLNQIECYRDADAKLQELQLHRDDLRRQDRELSSQLSRNHDIRDEVQALLHGDAAVDVVTVTRDEVAQVEHQLRVCLDAIELQRQAVQSARMEASAEIRKQALPEYRKIVQKMANTLAALREIAVEEYEFRNAMREGGVALTNEFVCVYGDCGEPAGDSRQDSIAQWERDARAAGHIR